MKNAKTEFLFNLIANNSHRPQDLFNVFNTLINPCVLDWVVSSNMLYENFLNVIIDKVSGLRMSPTPGITDPSASVLCPAVFLQFELSYLYYLSDKVPANCLLDSISVLLFQ